MEIRICPGHLPDHHAGLGVFKDRNIKTGQGGCLIDVRHTDHHSSISLKHRPVRGIGDSHEQLKL